MWYEASEQYLELTKATWKDRTFEVHPSDLVVETLYIQHAGQPIVRAQLVIEHIIAIYWRLLNEIVPEFTLEEWKSALDLPSISDPHKLRDECKEAIRIFQEAGGDYNDYNDEYVKVLKLMPRIVTLTLSECMSMAEVCTLMHDMDGEQAVELLSRVMPAFRGQGS